MKIALPWCSRYHDTPGYLSGVTFCVRLGFCGDAFADLDFMDLTRGPLELETLPDFLVELRRLTAWKMRLLFWEKSYQEKAAEEAEKQTLVPSASIRFSNWRPSG